MTARVLLVEDFVPFRDYVREMLQEHPGFEVVGEAADGLTGVQKAEELKPDIILLDVAMPWLNGLEAARQIARVSPKSRIIFLTEHDSSAMVQHALDLGARGYLIKSLIRSELFPALEAVLLGRVYLSKRVGKAELPDPGGE